MNVDNFRDSVDELFPLPVLFCNKSSQIYLVEITAALLFPICRISF
jgi:hypothetical protein